MRLCKDEVLSKVFIFEAVSLRMCGNIETERMVLLYGRVVNEVELRILEDCAFVYD